MLILLSTRFARAPAADAPRRYSAPLAARLAHSPGNILMGAETRRPDARIHPPRCAASGLVQFSISYQLSKL
jgi:hypothetical protein